MENNPQNQNQTPPAGPAKHPHLVGTLVGTGVILVVAIIVLLAFYMNFSNNQTFDSGVVFVPMHHAMFSQNGITIIEPQPNSSVSSPLQISGYGLPAFEAVAGHAELLDASGKLLGRQQLGAKDSGPSQPDGFSGNLIFQAAPGSKLTLRIFNDNPSGLPENSRTVDIPLVAGK